MSESGTEGWLDETRSAYLYRVIAEVERAREIWRRKFRVAPKTREERAKQMRFLQSRGFSFDAIRSVVGGKDD